MIRRKYSGMHREAVRSDLIQRCNWVVQRRKEQLQLLNRNLSAANWAKAKAMVPHAGTNQMRNVPLAITSISVSEGRFMALLCISGASFTPETKVIFCINPDTFVEGIRHLSGLPESTANLIYCFVPDQDGSTITGQNGIAQPYQGYVFVRHGLSSSSSLPFKWIPRAQFKQIGLAGIHLNRGVVCDSSEVDTVGGNSSVVHTANNAGRGSRGNDRIWQGFCLSNGWRLDSIEFFMGPGQLVDVDSSVRCGGHLTDYTIGSNWPGFGVHWWFENFNILHAAQIEYAFVVLIKGALWTDPGLVQAGELDNWAE